MKYRNFDLDAYEYQDIDAVEQFRVRVTRSPAGEQKYSDADRVTLPPGLRNRLKSLEQRELSLAELIVLGEDLAGSLFPPRARSYLNRSIERLRGDEGLRVRLKVETYALADVPWEYAYIIGADTSPEQRGPEGFLALNRRISLVRYELMGQSLVQLDPVRGEPLRMVALLANPHSLSYPHLDLDIERQNIQGALSGVSDLSAEFYPDATVESLEDALTNKAHIFHFSGHGEFEGDMGLALGSVEGKGFLVLVDESGQPLMFSSEKLAQNLRGRGVRLAVLGACEAGRRDRVNPWSGVAASLNRAGIPAVVGMQYSIRDENAITFNQRFYNALAAGQPVDAAVSDGRLSIFNRQSAGERDWGVPVLYLRAEDGILFPHPAAVRMSSLVGQLRPGKPGFLALVASIATLLLSLLSGLNQVAGLFSKISLPTAAISVLLAVIVGAAFPALLRREHPQGETDLKISYRGFSLLLAVLILVLGVGPFLGKYWIARQARAEGAAYIDTHQYSPARVQLDRAARYFEDLGFGERAADAKVILIQAYADLGEGEQAEGLIAEVEGSGYLNESLQGKLYAVRGLIAHTKGEFEQAERFYQLAHQTIEPQSKDEAILLQNEAVLWTGRGAPYRDRVLDNYEQAREIYEELDDQRGLAELLINEGNLFENEPEVARTYYEDADQVLETLEESYPHLQGTIAMNIGLTYRQQGRLDQAEEYYDLAQLEFGRVADMLAQAEVLVNQATLEWMRGNKELARQDLQSSEAYLRNIDLSGELTHDRQVAQIRTFQADIYDSLGESDISESHYQEALSIYYENPDPLKEANTLINYGGLLLRVGRGLEASSLFERAREIIQAYAGEGPHMSLGVVYNNMGKSYQDIGDLTRALEYYSQAVQIFEQLEDRLLYAQARENLGIVLVFHGNFVEGETALLEAREIYRELGNKDYEVRNLYNLYSLYGPLGVASAESLVQQILSLLVTHNIDQEIEAGVLLGILPQDLSERNDLITYRERVSQLKAFYERRNESIGLGRSLLKLADVEQKLGNFEKMVAYAREAETFVDRIPLPMRISAHSDLGFYLIGDNAEDGIDHFLAAFDLASGVSEETQQRLALIIQTYMSISLDEIDHQKYKPKVEQVLEQTDDPVIRDLFQDLLDLLAPRT